MRNKHSKFASRRRIALGGAAALVLAAQGWVCESSAVAIGPTWNLAGPAAGDWFNSSNWLPQFAPQFFLDATIDNGGTAQISSGVASAQFVYVGYSGSGTLRLDGGSLPISELDLGFNNGSSGTFIQTAGMVQSVLPIQVGTASGSVGTYNMTGGSVAMQGYTAPPGLMLIGGATTGSTLPAGVGTLNIGNTASLNVDQLAFDVNYNYNTGNTSFTGGTGTINQTGGSVNATDLYMANGGTSSYIQSGGVNTNALLQLGGENGNSANYLLSGGTHNVGSLVLGSDGTAPGTYTITGTGTLNATAITYQFLGIIAQAGGTVNCGSLSLATGSGYSLTGSGHLTAGSIALDDIYGYGSFYPIHFFQSGGTVTTGSLSVLTYCTYQYSGGSLAVGESLTVNGGTLNFASAAVSLLVNPADGEAGVNLSGASILNSSKASLIVQGSNSLVVLPAGFNTATQFASYSNAGLTHITGTPLIIGSTGTYHLNGAISDLVEIGGSLSATAGNALSPTNGAQVSGSGNLNLGSGTLDATGTTSLISGGQLSGLSLVIGNSTGTSVFTQTGGIATLAGSNTSNATLVIGTGTGTAGVYNLSAGTLSIPGSSVNASRGYIETNSGVLNFSGAAQLLADEVDLGSSGNGSVIQTGGGGTIRTLTISSSTSSYSLSGTGALATGSSGPVPVGNTSFNGVTVEGGGIFNQSGGTQTSTAIQLIGGSYNLTGGMLTAGSVTLQSAGKFVQKAGNVSIGSLVINSGGTYLYTGGTLNITSTLDIAGGNFNFGNAAVTLQIGSANSSAGVNLSNANFFNSSNASILIEGANTLVLLPAGFNPSQFKSFNDSGTVHVAGTTLNVAAGSTLYLAGQFVDHAMVQGTLDSVGGGQGLYLTGGVNVSGSGSVDLGDGSLSVADTLSGISGGTLNTVNVTVAASGGAVFNQTGGTVTLRAGGGETTGGLFIGTSAGTSGTYALGGGVLSIAGTAAYSNNFVLGNGSFVLSGGGVLAADSAYVGANAGGSSFTGVNGVFTQTGGTFISKTMLTIGDQGDNGAYIQSGGVAVDSVVTLSGDYTSGTGSYTLTGGTHSVSNLSIGAIGVTGATGIYTLAGTGQLTTALTTLYPNGKLNQTGGLNTAVDVFVEGGTYNISGGAFNLSDELQIAPPGFTFDSVPGNNSNGILVQTGGSVSTPELEIGAGGRYELAGGSLTVGDEIFVYNADLDFGSVNTGQVVTANSINLSDGSSLTHANQTMNIQAVDNVSGTLTQTAGTLTATDIGISGGLTQVESGGTISASQLLIGLGTVTIYPGGKIIATQAGLIGGTSVVQPGGLLSATLLEVGGPSLTVDGGASPGLVTVGAAGLSLLSSGIITLNADAVSPGRLTLNGDVSFSGTTGMASIVTSQVGSGQSAGVIDLGGGLRTFNIQAGGNAVDVAISANLSNGTLVKQGTGTLSLSGPNSFSGGLNVSSGTVILAAASSFSGGVLATASNAAFGTVQFGSDAALGAASNGINLSGGVLHATASVTTSRSFVLGAPSGTGDGTLQVDLSQTLTLNGPVTGGTALIKQGAGLLVLNGSLSYQGGTRIMAGTLMLGPGTSFPAMSVINIAPGATVNLGSQGAIMAALQDALLPNESRAGGTVLLGSATLTVGPLGASTVFSGMINGSSGGSVVMKGGSPLGLMTLAGTLTGFTGGVSVSEGTLLLTNPANTFSGGVAANGGALEVTSDSVMGASANNISLSSGGTLEATASFSTARGISVLSGGATIAIATGNTLTDAGNITGSSPLTISGTTLIPGSPAGSGTLNLTAAQSYSGAMTIDGSANPAGTSNVTVLLNGMGSLKSVASLTLLRQGTLEAYDTSGLKSGRLGSATSLNLSGGTLSIAGPVSATANESLGSLSVTGGNSTINLIDGGGTGSAVDLAFSSLSLASGATLSLNLSSSSDRIFFTTPPVENNHDFITGLSLIEAGTTYLHVQYSASLGIVPYGTPGAGIVIGSLNTTSVPEPRGLVACLVASCGLFLGRRRRKIFAV